MPVTSVGIAAGRQEVEQLLSDIAESKGGYYSLQPVVATRLADDEWELVDGQQRLTTLYLLYVCMQKAWLKNVGPRYSITYETRPASPSYLSELNEARNEDNIDFFPLYGAYRCIADWLEERDIHEPQFLADNLYRYLFETVRVIWYEAPPDADVVALFTRLNIATARQRTVGCRATSQERARAEAPPRETDDPDGHSTHVAGQPSCLLE